MHSTAFVDGEAVRRGPAVRTGFTLLELLVVLVILGVLAGVASFSLAAAPLEHNDDAGAAARDRALRAGVPVLDTNASGQLHLPDGRTVPVLPWTADSMPL